MRKYFEYKEGGPNSFDDQETTDQLENHRKKMIERMDDPSAFKLYYRGKERVLKSKGIADRVIIFYMEKLLLEVSSVLDIRDKLCTVNYLPETDYMALRMKIEDVLMDLHHLSDSLREGVFSEIGVSFNALTESKYLRLGTDKKVLACLEGPKDLDEHEFNIDEKKIEELLKQYGEIKKIIGDNVFEGSFNGNFMLLEEYNPRFTDINRKRLVESSILFLEEVLFYMEIVTRYIEIVTAERSVLGRGDSVNKVLDVSLDKLNSVWPKIMKHSKEGRSVRDFNSRVSILLKDLTSSVDSALKSVLDNES